MVAALLSLFGGSISGLLGNLLNGVMDHFRSKKELEAQLAMIKASQEGELLKAETTAAGESRQMAFQYDRRSFSEGLLESWEPTGLFGRVAKAFLAFLLVTVDVARGYTRPVVTWFSIGATAWMAMIILRYWDSSGGFTMISSDQTFSLVEYIVYFSFYTTSTVISYWFCERNRMAPPKMKSLT